MFTASFVKSAAERALKSAGQFGAGAWGLTVFTSVDQIINAFALVGAAIVYGAGISILTSLASAEVADKGTPSLVKEGK